MAVAEAYRREPRDGDWIQMAASWIEGDVHYGLDFSCRDLTFRMYWVYERPDEAPAAVTTGVVPADSLPSSAGGLNSTPGVFEVGIVPGGGLAAAAAMSRIFQAAARGASVLPGGSHLSSVGSFYRVFDEYALPRLFLGKEPPADQALFNDELLLQLALWARKFGHMPVDRRADDELARLFMRYAERIVGPERQADPEWLAAVDDVCLRLLLRARPRKGISAVLGRAGTFRCYVRKALTCAMRRSNPARPAAPSDGGFPASITEAAARLGVHHSTVWRRCRAGGWEEWCFEAWEHIKTHHQEKSAWRMAAQRLHEEGGKTREASRKAAYRAKKLGRTPDAL